MNSYGQTKLHALIDYIFYQEGVYKYVKGCKTYNQKKKLPDSEAQKLACQYMELVMKTNLFDDQSNRIEITLDYDVTLGACKKYLHGLIDTEGK